MIDLLNMVIGLHIDRYIKIDKDKNDLLFLICVFIMFIDHIGSYFFPSEIIYRFIGRLGLLMWPLMIANGVYYTSNRIKYFKSLCFVAFLTFIPWFVLHYDNITFDPLFYLSFAVLIICSIDNAKLPSDYFLILSFYLLLISYTLMFDGTLIIFVVLPLCFYYRLYALGIIFLSVYYISDPFQVLSILGFTLIYFLPDFRFKLPRLLKYSIYPFHYLVIVCVNLYLVV